ncbi:MAG: hypothetical protein GY906_16505, partial [bacterium]|nr:hypothetical protein [bacterium]
PVALVTVEPARRGYRYLFVTPRRIKVDEEEFGKDSLNYPFGIAVFEVSDWGKGEGQLHVAAALHIDTDGHVEVDDYNGAEGRFKDVKKVR